MALTVAEMLYDFERLLPRSLKERDAISIQIQVGPLEFRDAERIELIGDALVFFVKSEDEG